MTGIAAFCMREWRAAEAGRHLDAQAVAGASEEGGEEVVLQVDHQQRCLGGIDGDGPFGGLDGDARVDGI